MRDSLSVTRYLSCVDSLVMWTVISACVLSVASTTMLSQISDSVACYRLCFFVSVGEGRERLIGLALTRPVCGEE